jgi:hypothetical protein
VSVKPSVYRFKLVSDRWNGLLKAEDHSTIC